MIENSDDLMGSLLTYLNKTINSDALGKPDPRYFIAWCAPGIPYDPQDLTFAQFGLAPPPALPITEADKQPKEGAEVPMRPKPNMTGGDHVRMQIMQAEMFSRLVNTIPDVSPVWNPNGANLEDVYGTVLKNVQVAANEVTEADINKLKLINQQLTVMVDALDEATFQQVKRPDASPLVKSYERFAREYEAAVMARNSIRIAAMTSGDPQLVLAETLNGPTLDNQVKMAFDRWVGQGFKTLYERMIEEKSSIEGRSLLLTLRELRQRFEKSLITNPSTGSSFRFSTVIPPGFHQAAGWTKVVMNENIASSFDHTHDYNLGGKAGVNILDYLFNASAGGRTAQSERTIRVKKDNFNISFEFCQVPIIRPWFAPHFLRLRSWRFPDGSPDLFGQSDPNLKPNTLSAGPDNPKGALPAYAVSAIFARNITVHFDHLTDDTIKNTDSTSGNAKVNWGVFNFSIKGGTSDKSETHNTTFKDGTLTVSGMQLIGLKCHILDPMPAPDPNVKKWDDSFDKIIEAKG